MTSLFSLEILYYHKTIATSFLGYLISSCVQSILTTLCGTVSGNKINMYSDQNKFCDRFYMKERLMDFRKEMDYDVLSFSSSEV